MRLGCVPCRAETDAFCALRFTEHINIQELLCRLSSCPFAGRGRAQLLRFQNGDICRLTEQVIFTDPYHAAPVNRHTSPQLDDLAAAFRADAQAKAAITALKACFSVSPMFCCMRSCPLLLSIVRVLLGRSGFTSCRLHVPPGTRMCPCRLLSSRTLSLLGGGR